MGFWDAVVGAGKSAKNALEERAKQTYLERWGKLKSAPVDRLNDFYLQHKKSESNNPQARGLAIAAMAYQGVFNADSLWREDKMAANFLKGLRRDIIFVESSSADELRKIIDRLDERNSSS